MHSAVAVIGGSKMGKLLDLLGGYGVRATSDVDVNTEALIAKVKSVSVFTDAERAALIRALEWCVRQKPKKNSD